MLRWRVLLAVTLLLLVVAQPVLRRGNVGSWIVFGHDGALSSGQELEGHLIVLGGDAIVGREATVHGDVVSLGGSLHIAGRVDGQAYAPGGKVLLADTASVAGDVLVSGSVLRQPGAIVGGEVMSAHESPPSFSRWRQYCLLSLPGLWFGWPWGVGLAGNLLVWSLQVLLGTLAVVTLGILVMLVAPDPVERASHALSHCPRQSIGAGVLAWLLAIVGTPLLISTVIGIPVAAAIVALVAAGLLFAWVPAGLAIGKRALKGRAHRQPLLAATVGLATLAVLTSVPCVSFVVIGAIALWGLGAVLVTRFGTVPYERPSSPFH